MIFSFSKPADIAVELSHHAAQVYISTRSGCYVLTRLGRGGQPIDFGISRATQLIPLAIQLKFIPGLVNNKINFKNFGLQPTGTLGVQKFPIVNDAIQHRIITGSIKVKGNVEEIAQNSVTLEGGETLDNIDVLVLATGFKLKYPFAKDIIEVKDGFYTSLYKHVFLPDDEWHTLAVIGGVDVGAASPPVNEMQARIAAEVFAGRCSLPSKGDMEKEIAEREQRWLKTGASKKHFTRVSTLCMVLMVNYKFCCAQR
jgi:dimethylaniline monooxygenase (N-oxide forming)